MEKRRRRERKEEEEGGRSREGRVTVIITVRLLFQPREGHPLPPHQTTVGTPWYQRLLHPKVPTPPGSALPTKPFNPTDRTTEFKLNCPLRFKIQGTRDKRTSTVENCLLGSTKAKHRHVPRPRDSMLGGHRPQQNAHSDHRKAHTRMF